MSSQEETQTLASGTPSEQPTPPNSPGLCPLKVAKWAHAGGMVEKEQVDAMEAFVKGEMDYGTMRSMCG